MELEKERPTWQGECKTIAWTKDCISQQKVGPGYIACSVLTTACNKHYRVQTRTLRLDKPWIAIELALMPFLLT